MLDTLLRHLLLLIEPVGFLWACLLVLTIALVRRRLWRLAALSAFVVVTITVIGSTGLPGAMLASLERPYAGVKIDALPVCDAVVMLGGGTEPSRYEVGTLHLNQAGDRVLMALELIRLGKAPVLVLGGAGAPLDGEVKVEADLLARLLAEWKLPAAPATVVSLGQCTSTRDEAGRVLKLAQERGWRRVLLVTSANHMRRASAVFQTAGVAVVPAPCGFLTEVSTSAAPPGLHVPTWHGFGKISTWLHEQVGWWLYRSRGWIDPAKVAPRYEGQGETSNIQHSTPNIQ